MIKIPFLMSFAFMGKRLWTWIWDVLIVSLGKPSTVFCRNGGLESVFNCNSALHNTDCHALSSGLFVSGTDIDTTAPIGV